MRVLKEPLLERIRAKEARIGVVGMGYVGLPLAVAFAEAGFPVLGLDVDTKKADAINGGQSYIKHIPSEPIADMANQGRLRATTDFSRAKELD